MEMQEIEVSKITSRDNSRMNKSDKDIAALMGSIRQNGLLQPIGVSPVGTKFEVVYGNRRLAAIRKLGYKTIPCLVDSADEDDFLIKNLSENVHRVNIPTKDEGRIFKKLIEKGLTLSEVASRLDIPLKRVKSSLHVYKHIPKRFNTSVVSNGRLKKREGEISTSMAAIIMNNGRNLPVAEMETLFQYAQRPGINAKHVVAVTRLTRVGVPVKEAIDAAEDYRTVGINLLINKKIEQRMFNKTGKSIIILIKERLYKMKDLGISKSISSD